MDHGAPHCPKDLTLRNIVSRLGLYLTEPERVAFDLDTEDLAEVHNALRYLDNFLSARKGYQRKMQIKRKVLAKYAKEHGFDEEIDQAVREMHGNVMEAESLDDLEDTDAD